MLEQYHHGKIRETNVKFSWDSIVPSSLEKYTSYSTVTWRVTGESSKCTSFNVMSQEKSLGIHHQLKVISAS